MDANVNNGERGLGREQKECSKEENEFMLTCWRYIEHCGYNGEWNRLSLYNEASRKHEVWQLFVRGIGEERELKTRNRNAWDSGRNGGNRSNSISSIKWRKKDFRGILLKYSSLSPSGKPKIGEEAQEIETQMGTKGLVKGPAMLYAQFRGMPPPHLPTTKSSQIARMWSGSSLPSLNQEVEMLEKKPFFIDQMGCAGGLGLCMWEEDSYDTANLIGRKC
ncbi:uncharacterized protein WM277_025806 isoform 1-T3 [Molossus nigricans]